MNNHPSTLSDTHWDNYIASTCTPDALAAYAKGESMMGRPDIAQMHTAQHHRSKAYWVLVNGRWVSRRNIMRS